MDDLPCKKLELTCQFTLVRDDNTQPTIRTKRRTRYCELEKPSPSKWKTWTSSQNVIVTNVEQKFDLIMKTYYIQKYIKPFYDSDFDEYYRRPSQAYDVKFEIPLKNSYTLFDFQLVVNFNTDHNASRFILHDISGTWISETIRIKDIDDIFNLSKFDVSIQMFFIHQRMNTLMKDILRLHTSEKHSDFQIIAKNHVFNVHKFILCARSDYFSNMLSSEMKEKNSGQVKFDEWDANVVRELLNYMYSDICNVKNVAHNLFKLSHLMQMTDLQSICLKYLESNINEQNVVSTLRLVNEDKYELQELQKKALNYVDTKLPRLVECSDFLDYLADIISLDNISFVLKTSHNYKKDDIFFKAMKFLKCDPKSVLQNDKFEQMALLEPKLLFRITKLLFD